jgi:ABC-type antimicrobial peptide transport system permease subunit
LLAYIALKLAFRNASRNKIRSSILSIGLIISIGILSGIFAYVDTSSSQLISRSTDNLAVDISLNFANRSATFENVSDILYSLTNMPETEIFESLDPIVGGFPFEVAERSGFVISDSSNYTLSPFGIGANPEYFPAFAFGLTIDYLNRRNSPFTATKELSSEIADNEVWISTTLAERNNWKLGDSLNVSYGKGVMNKDYSIPMGNSANITISGFVEVDLGLMLENLDAYVPEIAGFLDEEFLSLIQFNSISADMLFMNWETMLNFTSKYPSSRIVHGVHLSLDNNKLGSDVDKVKVQLISIESKLATLFPELVVTNFAYNALEDISDRLISYRLFIMYFSLPGVLLGFIFASYVNNLTLLQRKKELAILRLRNTPQPTIQALIGMEVLMISLSGTGVGLLVGALSGSLLSLYDSKEQISSIFTLNFSSTFGYLTRDSIFSSLFIGLLFTGILTFMFIRQISKSELQQSFDFKTQVEPMWKKYNFDIAMVLLVGLTIIINETKFNPIPSFAQALYDLIIPPLTWMGLTLLALRLISKFFIVIDPYLIRVVPMIVGNTGIAIAKSLIRNRLRLTSPIMIIILTMSFAITLANVSSTFQYQADLEARYAVGADIRLQMPGFEQLDFKTDDFHKAIEEIPGISATDAFITIFPFGYRIALVLAIDPAEFLEIGYFQDDFFYYNTPKETLTTLANMEGGLGWIMSFELGFPYADGYDDISKGPPIFKQNETLPIEENEEDYNITILDVAVRLPGLSDMVGMPSDDIPYLMMDRRFFIEPLPNQEEALAPELANSTHLYVDVDEDIISIEDAKLAIEEVYEAIDSSYQLGIRTINDYNEEFFELGDLLLGLTQLEFAMALIVMTLTQILYVLSIQTEKQREFAILHGIGWQSKQIRRFTSAQVFSIGILGGVISILVSFIVTLTYIPLLSSLFLFSIVKTVFNLQSLLLVSSMLVISGLASIVWNKVLLERSNITGLLRET